jgi:lipoyl(octanoyl) transferase
MANSSQAKITNINILYRGKQDYQRIVKEMQQFTASRVADTPDEIWVTEHDPIFTLGFNGKPEHILTENSIPVVQTDRGGQVTYHGPGQIVIYLLIDIKRREMGVRNLVRLIEQGIIDLLQDYGITGHGDVNAPGVYVSTKKIAALGLRVKQKGTYHGLALNVDMDLTPYQFINPCGVKNAEITQLYNFGVTDNCDLISKKLVEKIIYLLNSNNN